MSRIRIITHWVDFEFRRYDGPTPGPEIALEKDHVKKWFFTLKFWLKNLSNEYIYMLNKIRTEPKILASQVDHGAAKKLPIYP